MATFLYSTDRQYSVLGKTHGGPQAYSPYGALPPGRGPGLAFCGQFRDPVTNSYPLGSGRRFYNPALMRFQSPDPLSPFARGGINRYAYCSNDPINYTDPSGLFLQYAEPVRSILNGVVNLGITAYKFMQDMRITRRYFTSDPEFAGSRQGHLATGTIEGHVPRLDLKQKLLMFVGGSTALTSIGTGVARLAGVNASGLMVADFAAGAVATLSSLVEVKQLVFQQLDARYPIQPDVGTFQPRMQTAMPEAEWPFSSGPTPLTTPGAGRRSVDSVYTIERARSTIRESAL